MRARETLDALLRRDFQTCLDIGSGDGSYANALRAAGKSVMTVNLCAPADHVGDYMGQRFFPVDAIWCSHVLEHQSNVGLFLQKCFRELKPHGWLAITVPPMKPEIVGGHLTLWNAGLLLYNLILAGFDCSQASVKAYGYNVSVIVQKRPAFIPELKMDFGDIEALAHCFPIPVCNGFDGNIREVNW
jgi:hypothetical protein